MAQNRIRGFETGVEYRKYFGRTKVYEPLCLLIWPLIFQLKGVKKDNSGLYFSSKFNYQYTRIEIPILEDFEEKGAFNINRHNPSLIFRFGFQSVNKYGFTIDQALGLGGQLIAYHNNRPGYGINETIYISKNNFAFFPKINYSFKIGWAF